ncbi:hypothetical protein FACS1894126_1930 [Alphaproteobacteria bacterium]|nr:hypothetical protein FACS1894126_1930 [Alphaproteobacteria bacterium]
MNSVLYSALQSRGIPSPKEEVTSDKFTRWGKSLDIGRYNSLADIRSVIFPAANIGKHLKKITIAKNAKTKFAQSRKK